MAQISIKKTLAKTLGALNPIVVNTMSYNQCSTGSYTRCYRVGKIVFLSFNINIKTATSAYDYITGLPPAFGGAWGCSGVITGGQSMRFIVTTSGSLRTDGNAYTGWVNGNVAYICQ